MDFHFEERVVINQNLAIAYGGTPQRDEYEPETLPEALARAAHQEDEKGIIYLHRDGTEMAQSYAELCTEAEYMLAGLRALGLRPGDKVVLQVEENAQYLPVFWACVLGGLVAVPLSIAPSYAQPGVITTKLQKAWELCEQPLVIASVSLAPALRALAPLLGMGTARIETVESVRAPLSSSDDRRWHTCQPDDIFMILFTSGSTGLPKGVTLTHRNVLSLAQGYSQLEGLTNQERTFNWMPLDHIGGLVAFHLRDVYLGCQQIHASPQTILQEPLFWLDGLDRYHATCTWAPNFAFSLLNERLVSGPSRSWDLSALHYILNAGEAIVPKTARRFLALSGSYGLRSTAIHPSWGMSETSSGVTFSSRFSLETTSDDDRFVDVGALIPDVWVRVVDDDDHVLEERQSGRIQVRGPTVTPGYYQNPALNQEVFTTDGWFDTGDVGFLQEGRLTITGRTKNIIIINGLNYYCHEIEAVVEAVSGVEVTYTGACAVRTGTENTEALAIFYGTQLTEEQALREQCREIRHRVVSAVGINPTYLLPLERQAIPKTETGKIQRNRLKQQLEDGVFADLCARMDILLAQTTSASQIDEPGAAGEVEYELLLLWQEVLNRPLPYPQTDRKREAGSSLSQPAMQLDSVSPRKPHTPSDFAPGMRRDANFFELGGDSLILMRLLARVQERFAVVLPPRSVFDFPTVARLAQQITRQQEEVRAEQIPPLLPVAHQGSLPLSFTQQRLWFLDQLKPGSVSYSVCGVFRLQGQLHIPILQQSLQEIIQRHETLRSIFPAQDGTPVLELIPPLELALTLIHLETSSPETRPREVEQRLTQEIQRPFNLAHGPLARFILLRLTEEEHILLTSFHHMIVDGWSMDLFYRELETLYTAFERGEASPLPNLPVQYVDFAFWQRQWLRDEMLERELAWWIEHLRGAPTLLALPTDRPRPPVLSDHGAHYSFLLPTQLLQRLKILGQREQSTLFMILLAAFNALLYRYSGQEDLVVGTFVANREHKALQALIGYFANTLALRLDLSHLPSFRELLARVRSAMLDAYAHQSTPFEQVIDALQIERNLSYSPLVQVAFVLQNREMFTLELSNLTSTLLSIESGAAKFDLLLEVVESEDGLSGVVEYNTDLFDEATIARMMTHWQNILERIVANPDEQIASLPLLSPGERAQLLTQWNATRIDYQKPLIHQCFEMQVERTPLAPALIFEGTSLTYAELNQHANQLARYLQRLGVGPDVLVGICMERSLGLLIGLLGILKAGGAYVPLDPTYPQERLGSMLEDSQVRVLLTQRQWLKQITTPHVSCLCLDEIGPQLAQESPFAPGIQLHDEHLAYMIYTSGSTGKPKGAMNTHKGMLNRLLWMQERYKLTEADVVLQKTPFSFDVSVWEFFWPLITGASLVIARPGGHQDSSYLVRLIQEQRVSTIHFVPPMLSVFLQERDVDQCCSLRQVICSGEALSLELQERFFTHLPVVRLHNLYGPTEASIDVTFWECKRENHQDTAVPIGHPIANTQIYLLDRHGQPVPVGTPAELFIGGIGLARGYLNRADLTAERFIPDPFSQEPGARLYRTGDLARYRSDGTIEYLGRLDNQVKLRGFRIELGEIEAHLGEHQAIQECVVLVREDVPGDRRLVAYIVPHKGAQFTSTDLRAFLQTTLPSYMLPAAFVTVDTLPLTPNGKVDRRALLALDATQAEHGTNVASPRTPLEQTLVEIWKNVLSIEHVGLYDNFFDLGGHSLLLVRVRSHLQETLQRTLSMTDLFKYPTISALVQFLAQDTATNPADLRVDTAPLPTQSEAIAVIGMAGRFPGASTIDEFWANLCNGVESIVPVSPEELLKDGIAPALFNDTSYVRVAALMDDIDLFDAAFFGYSPREAELIDPQQRLFLECSWQALEHAGYSTDTYTGSVGVYGSTSSSSYKSVNPALQLHPMASMDGYEVLLGNANDFLTTRVSYKLDLHGPSLNIQTACSSSLVAIHEAVQDLLEDRCQMALAGGVSIHLPLKSGYLYYEGGILAPDGHCRAFDADARGTVPGNGLGVVVLKRLADALRDRDTIYAVIKGVAVNNDGATKVGFTAPSVQGQTAAITRALQLAGVAPETVTYIETHGTGTALGDPIEIEALKQAFSSHTEKTGFCAIGSVKTNIGHADNASGVAGFIKTVLALHHGWLPPTLHYQKPNPQIDFASSPFYVNTRSVAWEAGAHPRRAGVSSFGIGGTNAHAVLEEAPSLTPTHQAHEKPWQILVFSARTPSALQTATARLTQHLGNMPDLSLADVAYTLQLGRKVMKYRQMLVCHNRTEAIEILETRNPQRLFSGHQETFTRSVAFLFPGQGAQYVAMAQELYQHEPVFRAHIDRCAELLSLQLGVDIRQLLYPETENLASASAQLDQTRFTQPVLFMIEYSLAQLWISWGVQPRAMLGHSIGEYVAACLAGVFSLEDALMLVGMRGYLMQQLPGGTMLAVSLPEQDIVPLLNADISLAAINAVDQCVVAGSNEAITELERRLAEQNIQARRLQTSHAFHSPMMQPIVQAFMRLFRQVRLHAPRIPYISNVTGTWITAEQAQSPRYWAQHILQTVRFADGLQLLLQTPGCVLLEVGPGRTLSSLVRQLDNEPDPHAPLILSSLGGSKKRQADHQLLLTALGHLWLAGCLPNWAAVHAPERPRRVPLPTYPFERLRYQVSSPSVQEPVRLALPESTPEGDPANWFYLPSWKRSWLPGTADQDYLFNQQWCWLVFCHEGELATDLIARLEQANQRVIRVLPGSHMSQQSKYTFTLDPRSNADYLALLKELRRQSILPRKILHMWSITDPSVHTDNPQLFEQSQDQGFYCLLFLAQALGEQSETDPLHLWVLSNNMQAVSGEAILHPEKATVAGVCSAITQEYTHISCQQIDLLLPVPGGRQEYRLLQQLLKELATTPGTEVVAYRGSDRWVQTFEHVPLSERPAASLRANGVYLLTGGMGGMGLTFAHYLAQQVRARLVLLGRSAFPAEDEWSRWLASHDDHDATSQKIRRLRAMQELGAQVLVLQADVSNYQEMQAAAARITERFGPLNGIIHAAGVPGDTRIQNKTRTQAELVLTPKVRGTQVLAAVFQQAELDFLILCSSVSALAGGFGQADYCGANAYLDAFAHYNTLIHDVPTISINWDRWQEVGMGAQTQNERDSQADEYKGILPGEAVKAFARVLNYASSSQFCQIMISAHDLQTQRQQSLLRREKWFKAQDTEAIALPPASESESVSAYQQLEQQLMFVWRRALGLQEVGLDDNFFDLGGDSLVSVRMMALARNFGIRVTQKQILEYPTIAELAKVLEGQE